MLERRVPHANPPVQSSGLVSHVNCGRYVGGHAVHHQTRTGHPMALSFADLSVWCYMCESYVHNEILIPAKNAAHRSKFGVPDPQHETSAEDSQ
ncbi:unnamed protein product [Gongylonema pulchrum]|uniref:UBP-type domain-containing protein n=1 Tax=Gongylonema pulchrum TaxID=637853 RepID=A0A183DWS2_9BILA|nr:unnamed protein product [Gongylonema pulchrum]